MPVDAAGNVVYTNGGVFGIIAADGREDRFILEGQMKETLLPAYDANLANRVAREIKECHSGRGTDNAPQIRHFVRTGPRVRHSAPVARKNEVFL